MIDKKYYTATEDRPLDQEQVDRHREHNLYEKDFKQAWLPISPQSSPNKIGHKHPLSEAAQRFK